MKLLIYKLYRLALTQKDSASPKVVFLSYLSIFELLHIAIISIFIKIIRFEFKIPENGFFLLGSMIAISYLNYFIFIKSKLIYRINDYYQAKNYSVWKGNLFFFGYVGFLFVIMFIQTWYYQNYKA